MQQLLTAPGEAPGSSPSWSLHLEQRSQEHEDMFGWSVWEWHLNRLVYNSCFSGLKGSWHRPVSSFGSPTFPLSCA